MNRCLLQAYVDVVRCSTIIEIFSHFQYILDTHFVLLLFSLAGRGYLQISLSSSRRRQHSAPEVPVRQARYPFLLVWFES